MNKTTIINIRTNSIVKNQARELADKLGLSLSSIVNAYLRQFIRTRSVSFSLGEQPSEFLLKALVQSKKDIGGGYTSPVFDNTEDADKWLDNPKAKYANQIHKRV